jgi:hypothetical protein
MAARLSLAVKLTDDLGRRDVGGAGCGVGECTVDGDAVDGGVGPSCGLGGVGSGGTSSPRDFQPTISRCGLVRGPNFVFIGLSLRRTIGSTFAPRRALVVVTASRMCLKAMRAPVVAPT